MFDPDLEQTYLVWITNANDLFNVANLRCST